MVNNYLAKTKLGGLDFWYRNDDKYIGQRVALEKYEEYEAKLILNQIRGNDVVVDVGANIGYYTLLMALKAKKVYTIEPEEENFKILKKNVEANNLKNVVLIRAAASDKKGKIKLYKSEENWGDHRVFEGINRHIIQEVNCLRLDDILSIEQEISLIKIDVQGWEPAVINGAKKILKKDSPVLFLEYWPAGIKEAKLDGEKMIGFLKTIYKNIWQIDDGLNIYKKIGKEIEVDKKTGYKDLWMKKEMEFEDYIKILENANYKKIIKGIIRYGKNK